MRGSHSRLPLPSPAFARGLWRELTASLKHSGDGGSRLREVAALARLGAPMAATLFFVMGTGFLDTAMAGRYDSTHLAGVALGSSVLWPVFLLLSGCAMAVMPIAAQLAGGGRRTEVGTVIRHGLLVAALASAPAAWLVANASSLFALFDIDAAAADVAIRYLRAAALGCPPEFATCFCVTRLSR